MENTALIGDERQKLTDLLDERKKTAAAQIWKSYLNWKITREERENYKKLAALNHTRTSVVQEIISTEQAYVKSLKLILQVFLYPLRDAAKTDKPIINKDTIHCIFSGIEVIFAYNKVLLERLEERARNWTPHTKISDIFQKMSQFLLSYTSYVNNYTNSHETINKMRKNSKEFKLFLADAEKIAGMDISSYLIMPIQRIPRYTLLLQALTKHTWNDHPDYEDLLKAAKSIEKIASTINEKIRELENTHKVFQLQFRVMNLPVSLVKVGRRIVKEVETVGISYRGENIKTTVILLNDIVLWCRKQKNKALEFFRIDNLAELTASVTDDVDGKPALQILSSVSPSFVVYVRTVEERDFWIQTISATGASPSTSSGDIIREQAETKTVETKAEVTKVEVTKVERPTKASKQEQPAQKISRIVKGTLRLIGRSSDLEPSFDEEKEKEKSEKEKEREKEKLEKEKEKEKERIEKEKLDKERKEKELERERERKEKELERDRERKEKELEKEREKEREKQEKEKEKKHKEKERKKKKKEKRKKKEKEKERVPPIPVRSGVKSESDLSEIMTKSEDKGGIFRRKPKGKKELGTNQSESAESVKTEKFSLTKDIIGAFFPMIPKGKSSKKTESPRGNLEETKSSSTEESAVKVLPKETSSESENQNSIQIVTKEETKQENIPIEEKQIEENDQKLEVAASETLDNHSSKIIDEKNQTFISNSPNIGRKQPEEEELHKLEDKKYDSPRSSFEEMRKDSDAKKPRPVIPERTIIYEQPSDIHHAVKSDKTLAEIESKKAIPSVSEYVKMLQQKMATPKPVQYTSDSRKREQVEKWLKQNKTGGTAAKLISELKGQQKSGKK